MMCSEINGKLAVQKVKEYFSFEDADDDMRLDSYFIETRFFKKLNPNMSAVLIGGYGTGKTAIIRHIAGEFIDKVKNRIVPINLQGDIFADELKAARETGLYATFCESLVYLHIIYAIAQQVSGTLTTGARSALIKELRELKLSPYGDIISRLSQASMSTVGRIKRIDVAKIFSVEKFDPPTSSIDLGRYRSFCLAVRALVHQEINKNPTLIIIDNVDAAPYAVKETAHMVGAMLRWLRMFQKDASSMRFLVALPKALVETMRDLGEHNPAQEMFYWLSWSRVELENLIQKRLLYASLAEEPLRWLEDITGFNFEVVHELTYSRPRNYIKLVRILLQERSVDISASSEQIWDRGLQEYATQVLNWIGIEWATKGYDSFSDIIDILRRRGPDISFKILEEILIPIRDSSQGNLRGKAIVFFVEALVDFELLKSMGKGEYKVNKTVMLSGELAAL